jgi:hypothetical protein
MAEVSWWLVAILAPTGIAMALLSCLVGMRPKVENPAWWALYAAWIVVTLALAVPAPFWTLWISSALAGLLHGTTTALLLDRYIGNNPWHADKMEGPHSKLATQFIVIGVVVGTVFGAVVAGIAWALGRWMA